MKAQNLYTKKLALFSYISSVEDDSIIDNFLNLVQPIEKKSNKKVNFPSMTEKQIIDRVAVANKEIEKGKTISQDQLDKDSQNW
jgi:hypothetical protein